MPAPLLLAGISAATGIGQTMLNNGATRAANNRAFDNSVAMYERQRKDSLTDRAFENEYNSPAQQMARLKAAGLNPNLAYGNGAVQSTSVSTPKTTMSTPDVKAMQYQNVAADSIQTYLQAKFQDAQIDKIIQDTKTSQSQEDLNYGKTETEKWKIESEHQKYEKLRLENYLNNSNLHTNITMRKEQLNKLIADKNYTLHQDERAEALKSQSIKESIERILSLRMTRSKNELEKKQIEAQIKSLSQDQRLKAFDEHLNKMGINNSSPEYLKAAAWFANEIFGTGYNKVQ